MTTKKVNRGGIGSNLDKVLTSDQIKEGERKEARDEFISRRYSETEKNFKEGTETPDVIYDLLQKPNVYSADWRHDKDPASLKGVQTLPIKEFNIMPDGTYGITLMEDSAALEAVKQGIFCHACLDRQPESPELWKYRADLLAERIGPRPSWAQHKTMCCFCGAKLGIDGDHKQSGVTQITPEQQKLLETMFGKIRIQE
jgi:hypothetical protein